jgi:glutamate synthase domain-containing protein 1
MATESAITTQGSHPYSTSEDECLVHNGSLSNHNNVRRSLIKDGQNFNSEMILKLQLDIFQIKYQKAKI